MSYAIWCRMVILYDCFTLCEAYECECIFISEELAMVVQKRGGSKSVQIEE